MSLDVPSDQVQYSTVYSLLEMFTSQTGALPLLLLIAPDSQPDQLIDL